MALPSWNDVLTGAFPNLATEGFEIVGQPSEQYNCIAYAAGDTSEWWWPDGINYWPPWATLTNRIESLQEAFSGQGYERCDDSNAEAGYHKVALYESHGEMRHAAAQIHTGRWRSKMGKGPVIEHHNTESLSGGVYGEPTVFMRRATVATDHR